MRRRFVEARWDQRAPSLRSLFALSPSPSRDAPFLSLPWNHTHCSPLLPSVFPLLYSASILFRPPLSFNQGCFLRVPSASCSLCIQHSPSLSLLSSVHASCRNWGPGSNRSWISTDLIDTQSLENREPVFSFFFSLNRESMELVEISSGGNGEERMRWLDEKFLETGEGKVAWLFFEKSGQVWGSLRIRESVGVAGLSANTRGFSYLRQ